MVFPYRYYAAKDHFGLTFMAKVTVAGCHRMFDVASSGFCNSGSCFHVVFKWVFSSGFLVMQAFSDCNVWPALLSLGGAWDCALPTARRRKSNLAG